ncbi:MAG TPA: hypothetical protein VF856_03300 [Gemmatimonadaceae bacterium]
MTQVLSPSDADVKDFTEAVHVKFRIDDDIFYGVTGIPAMDLMHFGAMFEGLTERGIMQSPNALSDLFNLILRKESADLFIARMADKDKPITLGQAMKVLPWLMEEYGMRPTQPSSSSSGGSENPDDGTSSTASIPTSELSQSTAS